MRKNLKTSKQNDETEDGDEPTARASIARKLLGEHPLIPCPPSREAVGELLRQVASAFQATRTADAEILNASSVDIYAKDPKSKRRLNAMVRTEVDEVGGAHVAVLLAKKTPLEWKQVDGVRYDAELDAYVATAFAGGAVEAMVRCVIGSVQEAKARSRCAQRRRLRRASRRMNVANDSRARARSRLSSSPTRVRCAPDWIHAPPSSTVGAVERRR